MRVVALAVVIVAITAFAQQPASPQPGTQPQAPSATQPGHPLDPNDVDILTGKKDAEQRQRPMPQVYVDYPVGSSMFNQSVQVGEVAPGSILSSGQFGGRFINAPQFGRTHGHFNHGLATDIAILTGRGDLAGASYLYTSQFNGSMFGNVSTETRPPVLFFPIQKAGAAPTFIIGNTTPATRFFSPRSDFHITSPGSRSGTTAPVSSPSRRP